MSATLVCGDCHMIPSMMDYCPSVRCIHLKYSEEETATAKRDRVLSYSVLNPLNPCHVADGCTLSEECELHPGCVNIPGLNSDHLKLEKVREYIAGELKFGYDARLHEIVSIIQDND